MPAPREVSVVLLKTARLADPSPAYAAWLDIEELRRTQAFSRQRDAREYAATHALLRACLSQVAESRGVGVSPARWRFALGARGKPHLAPRDPALDLRFSLSHGDGLVAVAVTLGCEVGIDVERESRQIVHPLRIARVRFSPAEYAELAAMDDVMAQRRRFMAIWTRMEALAKGTGLGLAMRRDSRRPLPLGPEDDNQPKPDDRRADWRFSRWRYGDHLVALAAERREGESLITPCKVVRWNATVARFEEAPAEGLQPLPP